MDVNQLKKLRNQAQEKANYYRQRFNIEPTARNMYVRWKAKKQHYDMLIDNARKLTARGGKEMDYSTFLFELTQQQLQSNLDKLLPQVKKGVPGARVKYVRYKNQLNRLKMMAKGSSDKTWGQGMRDILGKKGPPKPGEKAAEKKFAKGVKELVKGKEAKPTSPASPPAKPMPQQQPVPKPTGGETKAAKGGEGIIGKVQAAAKAHPKTAAVLAGAALGAGALMAYKRFFSQAARACKGLSGGDKTKCMLQYQAKGVNAAISNLKSKMGQCKGDPKCKAKIQKQIGKYQNKLNKLKSKIG